MQSSTRCSIQRSTEPSTRCLKNDVQDPVQYDDQANFQQDFQYNVENKFPTQRSTARSPSS